MALLVEALRYNLLRLLSLFIDLILPATLALVSSQPLTKMRTRVMSWGVKVAGA